MFKEAKKIIKSNTLIKEHSIVIDEDKKLLKLKTNSIRSVFDMIENILFTFDGLKFVIITDDKKKTVTIKEEK